MQAVTITQITPEELEEIIKRSLRDVLNSMTEKADSNPDRWFDINELRQYLPDKPARPTVYNWVQTNRIPFHKGGKKLRFLKSEIDVWLKRDGVKKDTEESDQLMYINDVANFIDPSHHFISRLTVDKWVNRGLIPFISNGKSKQRTFSKSKISAWLSEPITNKTPRTLIDIKNYYHY